MTGRLGVWFMRVLAHVPLPALRALGWCLGQLLYVLAVPRRKVALRNLALCFPKATVGCANPHNIRVARMVCHAINPTKSRVTLRRVWPHTLPVTTCRSV